MNKSETINKLSSALIKAQAEFPAIPFDSTNPYYNSRYASLGSVIQTVKPILAKYGLAIIQLTLNHASTNNTGVETILVHESGEYISEQVFAEVSFMKFTEKNGQVFESENKNYIQDIGKNITYLRRYAYTSILGLYADEDTDGNALNEETKIKPDKKSQPAEEKKIERPYTPEQLKDALQKMTKFVTPASNKQIEFLAMLLSQETITDDERHKLQKFLFGEDSLTKVDKKLVNAGIKWLDPINEGGTYIINDVASKELALALEFINQ